MAKIITDVKSRGITSAYIDAPFDKGLEILQEQGYSLISLEQNAYLRIQEGKASYISQNGNWVREGIICIPNKGKFLTKNSPVLAHAVEATASYRKNQEYYITNEQVEASLEGAIEITSKQIPTSEFNSHPLTLYAFEQQAEAYGQFLQEAGIKEWRMYTSNLQDKPFANQLWFGSLDSDSGLYGSYGDLFYDGRVRGVRACAEGAKKI